METLNAGVQYPITTWTDPYYGGVGSGSKLLYYKISAVDNISLISVPDSNRVKFDPNAPKISNEKYMATENILLPNYPNPFNPSTTIKYKIKDPGLVKLEVYDILGNKVRDLVNEVKDSGDYGVEFKSDNLSSGIYFCKISVNNFTSIQKMILMK